MSRFSCCTKECLTAVLPPPRALFALLTALFFFYFSVRVIETGLSRGGSSPVPVAIESSPESGGGSCGSGDTRERFRVQNGLPCVEVRMTPSHESPAGRVTVA
jgi:hypothetical protein